MGAHQTTSPGELRAVDGRRQEIWGIVALTLTTLLVLALGSSGVRGMQNLVGPVGSGVAGLLLSAFGLVAWVIPLETGLLTYRLFRRRPALLGVATMGSTLVVVAVGAALAHLATRGQPVYGDALAGGAIGELFGEVLRSLLGAAGTAIVGGAVLVMAIIVRTPWTIEEVGSALGRGFYLVWRRTIDMFVSLRDAWVEARDLEALAEEAEIVSRSTEPKIIGVDDEHEDSGSSTPALFAPIKVDHTEAGPKKPGKGQSKTGTAAMDVAVRPSQVPGAARIVSGPASDPQHDALQLSLRAPKNKDGGNDFELPPADLLEEVDRTIVRVDAATLRSNAELLTEKLAAYGVQGRVDEIHPGPVVTMYEFEPRSGTKVSKIAGLADDLAMALAAQKVRIVAPIPGKARVGFELPNDDRQKVFMREILEDRRWQDHDGSLPIALGKDIAGQPVYGDLAKMPHLLVAGATGSGKSVGLNVMLASILSKKTPDEVRMLMIDPKVVELQVFDGIPHMLLPVVTDMKKAALALRWAVDEMERRYQLFADAGSRNIDTFNRRVDKVRNGDLAPEKFMPRRKNKVAAQGPDGEEVLLDAVDGERPDALDAIPERLPYVVVVVDEFADLMMVAAKDVEACIARLAQKARAAGIHVILATQRPSVDVITGMIKANFPARIAFKVSQRQDSMTILGRQGAEHLLGMGDMLMLPPGSSELRRVHAAYISEDDVREVCDFLREQGDPVYQNEILKPREDDGFGGGDSDDPLYDRAVQAVAEAGYCSISHVQRQLSVGYNKAAKLVEKMEQNGVVGPPSSKAGGRREVLVSPH